MGDEHLDTIPATESDEVIKSSVEDLIPIPSESECIPDNVCDVPLCNKSSSLEAFKEHSETIIDSNDDNSSSDDDYPYGEDIDYVDASTPMLTETFSFNLEEFSVAVHTNHSELSLTDYKAFYFPPADRSVFIHEEFADDSPHIMSLRILNVSKYLRFEPFRERFDFYLTRY
ncbi:hypothetical protein Tco_0720854 [Tanacetum coccineum]